MDNISQENAAISTSRNSEFSVKSRHGSSSTGNNKMAHQAAHVQKNDRIFHKDTGWYFATREGLDMGPFPSRRSAEHEIAFYLKSMNRLSRAS